MLLDGFGIVPVEVQDQQDLIARTLKKIRATWPESKESYRISDVHQIIAATTKALDVLGSKIAKAGSDSFVQKDSSMFAAAEKAIVEINSFASVLASFSDAAQTGEEVTLTAFRTAITTILDRSIEIWKSVNDMHNALLSWMDGVAAEEIGEAYQSVLTAVEEQPGATKPLSTFVKVAVGVAGLVGLGVTGYAVLRSQQQANALASHNEEEIEMPHGIHILGPGHRKPSGPLEPHHAIERVESIAAIIDRAAERVAEGEEVRTDIIDVDGSVIRVVG